MAVRKCSKLFGCARRCSQSSRSLSISASSPSDILSAEQAAHYIGSSSAIPIDLGHPAAIARLSFKGARASPLPGTVKGGDGLVLPLEQVSSALAEAGIAKGNDLLLLDDGQGVAAARFWWVLRYYGFEGQVKVLNGGTPSLIQAIQSGNEAVLAAVGPGAVVPDDDARTAAAQNPVPLSATDEWLYSPEDASASIGIEGGPSGRSQDEKVLLLDVRTEGEWSGDDERGNPVTGRLPGAVHLPHARLFKEGSREFLTGDAARALLQESGVPPPDADGLVLAPYCQSGVRASLAALVAHSAGYKVRNYDGSFGYHAKHGFAVEE